MSPTQRSLKLLRDNGFSCYIVERWNSFAKIRQDAFRFGDILAFTRKGGYEGIWLIQCTSGDNHSKRVYKIRSEPLAVGWLEAGGRICVLSWSKLKNKGKRQKWTPRWEELINVEPLAPNDLEELGRIGGGKP